MRIRSSIAVVLLMTSCLPPKTSSRTLPNSAVSNSQNSLTSGDVSIAVIPGTNDGLNIQLKMDFADRAVRAVLCETSRIKKGDPSTFGNCEDMNLQLLSGQTTNSGRKIFMTPKEFAPASDLYTTIAYDAGGKLVATQHFSLKRKVH